MKKPVVPAPPASLSEAARARWQAVAALVVQRGGDLDLLATYCQVWVRWKDAEDGIAKTGQIIKNARGQVVASPLIAIASQASREVRSLEARLGLGAPETEVPPSDDDALVTRRVLAVRMNVHPQTVCKWERDGMPIAERGRKGRASRYRESDCRAWFTAREEAAKNAGHVDVAQERARKERAQAVLAEQLAATRSRLLLPAEEVAKIWGGEVAAVRAIILASYTSQADRVFRAATLDGVRGVERQLKELAHEVLRELANPDRPAEVA